MKFYWNSCITRKAKKRTERSSCKKRQKQFFLSKIFLTLILSSPQLQEVVQYAIVICTSSSCTSLITLPAIQTLERETASSILHVASPSSSHRAPAASASRSKSHKLKFSNRLNRELETERMKLWNAKKRDGLKYEMLRCDGLSPLHQPI